MTVAWYTRNWMAFDEKEFVDVPATVANLKTAEAILDEAVALKQILDTSASGKTWPSGAERKLDCDHGRIGFHIRGAWDAECWNPGVFVGVLLDGTDTRAEIHDPEHGDAVVLLCLHERYHAAARARSACSPPAMIFSLPSRAPVTPPVTGASTKAQL